jgi:hypothetical protein
MFQKLNLRLALSKGSNRVGVSLPSPEDGNRTSVRNGVFSSYLAFRTMEKVHKLVILNAGYIRISFTKQMSGWLSRYSDWLRAVQRTNSQQRQDSCPLHITQTDSGAHSATYPVSTLGPYPRG